MAPNIQSGFELETPRHLPLTHLGLLVLPLTIKPQRRLRDFLHQSEHWQCFISELQEACTHKACAQCWTSTSSPGAADNHYTVSPTIEHHRAPCLNIAPCVLRHRKASDRKSKSIPALAQTAFGYVALTVAGEPTLPNILVSY